MNARCPTGLQGDEAINRVLIETLRFGDVSVALCHVAQMTDRPCRLDLVAELAEDGPGAIEQRRGRWPRCRGR